MSGELERAIKQIFGIRADLQDIITKKNIATGKVYTLEEHLLEVIAEAKKECPNKNSEIYRIYIDPPDSKVRRYKTDWVKYGSDWHDWSMRWFGSREVEQGEKP